MIRFASKRRHDDRARLLRHLHSMGKSLRKKLRKKYCVGEYTLHVFPVIVRLKQPDPECDLICELLDGLHQPPLHHLGFGGGSQDGQTHFLFAQANRPDGKLASCSEGDRQAVAARLETRAELEGFLVGPLDPTGTQTVAEMDRETEHLESLWASGRRGLLPAPGMRSTPRHHEDAA